MKIRLLLSCLLAGCVAVALTAGEDPQPAEPRAAAADQAAPAETADWRAHRLGEVMSSRFCAECHPAIYAEHAQNTHGRAYTDAEVRLATGRFDHGDCIRCHTPRPSFETGIGMNPIRRFHNLEEGNTCMTCHWKPAYDYAGFDGGAECVDAFDDRVGTVEACASCHRNHGTPYQWEIAPTGKLAGNSCVELPRAEGSCAPSRSARSRGMVSSHVFPGGRSERQLRKAYRYAAEVEGNEAVVRITNRGAGHHFPTELKQRSVESVMVVRDVEGNEVSRSRMVFRDPYKRPYGLKLPVNTQIPPGETREHRVPLKVAGGTVDCELHFKLYFPIEDHHPELARMLESKRLVFDGVTPSDKEVESAPDVPVRTPEAVAAELASPANLVDFARPPIGTVEVDVPEGEDPETIQKLIELFQFPVPEGNRLGQARLVEIGMPAVPALIEAMGSWDNKTWNQAMSVLLRIGEPAIPSIVAAMKSDQLYIRMHARNLLRKMGWLGRDREAVDGLIADLGAENALDRRSAADLLGALRVRDAAGPLRDCLVDDDPDVVRSAGFALARMRDRESVPELVAAMKRAYYPETRMDLAVALGRLGSVDGLPLLLDGLDYEDDLIREKYFEAFHSLTRVHLGYEPLMPYAERLAALSRLQAWWMKEGGADVLRPFPEPSPRDHGHAFGLVKKVGGTEKDAAIVEELVRMGEDAVPALILGLKYPAGFADKRVRVCEALGRIGSERAAPALTSVLRDPVVAVAAWACWALEQVGDDETRDALIRYRDRLQTLNARGQLPANVGSADVLFAQAARASLAVGDGQARDELVRLLLSDDVEARRVAIDALESQDGERRGYDPEADLDARRKAAGAWLE